MSVYRPDAAGVTVRGPGEPCDHRFVVSYTDAYGTYTRCKVCRATWEPRAPQIEAERPIPADPEPVRTMFRNLGFWPTKSDPFQP